MKTLALIFLCCVSSSALAQEAPLLRSSADPSPRTVEQLAGAVSNIEDKINLRFEANDKAVQLLQDFANRQPTVEAVDVRLTALKELTSKQFEALTDLINARAEGTKVSLDAALVTRKEATDKIEQSFTRQLEALSTRLDDMKERIDTGEGRGTGRTDIIGWIVGGVAVLGMLLTHFARKQT